MAFATLLVLLGGLAAVAWSRLDPDRLWAEAQEAIREGRPAKAESSLRWIHRLRARTAADRMLEAQIALARGREDDAVAAAASIPDTHPLAAQAHLLIGRVERQRNRVAKAEDAFRRALKCEPKLIQAHRELIYIYGTQLRRREVDAEFRALAELQPLDHHDLFIWALTHFSTWNTDVSKSLENYIRADPEDRVSRLALARVYLETPDQQGRIEEVLAPLPETDPDARAILAQLALDQGRLEDAESLASSGPPDHPELARIRGKVAMIRRDYPAAVGFFRKALSPEPYDRVSNNELGRALILAGKPAEAEPYLTRYKLVSEVYNLIVQIQSPDRPRQPEDVLKMASALEAAGLLAEADGWYSLAIQLNPLDAKAQAGLHRVQKLEKR